MTKTVPYTGGEKESLHIALDRHRDAVLWKLDGLIDGATGTHPQNTSA
ncbi:hypothetical protein ACNPQM_19035 [Streptomyces sp. NPDC056231]